MVTVKLRVCAVACHSENLPDRNRAKGLGITFKNPSIYKQSSKMNHYLHTLPDKKNNNIHFYRSKVSISSFLSISFIYLPKQA